MKNVYVGQRVAIKPPPDSSEEVQWYADELVDKPGIVTKIINHVIHLEYEDLEYTEAVLDEDLYLVPEQPKMRIRN